VSVVGVFLVLLAAVGGVVWFVLREAEQTIPVPSAPRERRDFRERVRRAIRRPSSGLGLLRMPRVRRRRVRFEDSFDLTVPVADPSSEADEAREDVEEHVPLDVRLIGAIWLIVLVALSAAAVAGALWMVGYFINRQFSSVVGP
jgi:hypothetical protein